MASLMYIVVWEKNFIASGEGSQSINSMSMDHEQDRGIKTVLLYIVEGYLWHVDRHLLLLTRS